MKKHEESDTFEKGDRVLVLATGQVMTVAISFYYVERHKGPSIRYALEETGRQWYTQSELEKENAE